MQLYIIGVRDLEPGQKANLHEAGVMVSAMERAIERVRRHVNGLYLSFDMDVIDPRRAPGAGRPVTGRPTQGEAGKRIGMDVQYQNGTLAVEFVLSALGKRTWHGD